MVRTAHYYGMHLQINTINAPVNIHINFLAISRHFFRFYQNLERSQFFFLFDVFLSLIQSYLKDKEIKVNTYMYLCMRVPPL